MRAQKVPPLQGDGRVGMGLVGNLTPPSPSPDQVRGKLNLLLEGGGTTSAHLRALFRVLTSKTRRGCLKRVQT